MFEELKILPRLLLSRGYLFGVLVDVAAYHATKWIGAHIFALLSPYGFDVYDRSVYAALALFVFSLNFGSQAERVEAVMVPGPEGATRNKPHDGARLALWLQTTHLAALLVIASMLPGPVHFIMFMVCTTSMLALGGFQSLAERWLEEGERRPLFKADWQTMFLPSAMLAFLYYGDYQIDPKDLLWFDPLTALSFVFAPVLFTHAFHRMRGTMTA